MNVLMVLILVPTIVPTLMEATTAAVEMVMCWTGLTTAPVTVSYRH